MIRLVEFFVVVSSPAEEGMYYITSTETGGKGDRVKGSVSASGGFVGDGVIVEELTFQATMALPKQCELCGEDKGYTTLIINVNCG